MLAAGLSPLLSVASAAEEVPQETVVPATLRSSYLAANLNYADTTHGGEGAGVQGVFHHLEGHPGWVWTRYADGRTFDAPAVDSSVAGTFTTGSDVLVRDYWNEGRYELWNAVDGTVSSFQVPAKYTQFAGYYGGIVVAYETLTAADGTETRVVHLLSAAPDGTTRDVTVSGAPEGMKLSAPARGDTTGLVLNAFFEGTIRSVAVDPGSGVVQSWTPPLPTGNGYTEVSPERLVRYGGRSATKAYVFDRSDLSRDPVEVTLDNAGATYPANDLSVVGDWIVHRPAGAAAVTAVPVAGGDPVTLLPATYEGVRASQDGISASPSGTSVVIGRTGADDWGIQRIHPGADGRPVVSLVKALPKPPYKIQGLALEQGRLLVADKSGNDRDRDTYVRTVAATGTPTYGVRSSYDGTEMKLYSCPPAEGGCAVFGTADDRAVWLMRDDETRDRIAASGPAQYDWSEQYVPAGGRITDVSGEYAIHTTATQQIVLKLGDSSGPKVTRAPGAAALDGDVLWTAGATPGTVTAYNLSTKRTTETLTTDAGCTPTELQALGRYLYWTCDDRAGVYDRTAKRSVPVPADEAKLGDGYVVTHDKRAGKLTLTTVDGGTPSSRVIGDLPDTGVSQRDVRWTVDEAGANAAYVDDQEQVHLVPSGVAQQPLRLLGPAENSALLDAHYTDPTYYALTNPLLSKPANWRMTVRNKATGKVVDTVEGSEARGAVKAGWDGVTASGFAPNGSYEWSLSVTPVDGVGAPLSAQGSFRLMGAGAVHRDHAGPDGVPDGIGDLLVLNSAGRLNFRAGTGTGTFSGESGGVAWPTSLKAVPFGDLSGDRCNDVLVRYGSGALRLYKPDCGGYLEPSTPYTSLGTSGWTQYDVLTAPGDVTKDGRPDLIVRNASTGAVYLYKGTSTGKLSARVKLYDNWKTYKKIVGAGDLNGDGIGDLIAQDKSNNLYRYDGKGDGTFKARVKVFSAWGGSYNVVVGVGDITGDGKADIVARDTSGNLYRNNGDGKGSFGARTKIASGWQVYKGIF